MKNLFSFSFTLITIILFLSSSTFAQRWEQIGKKGDWENTIDVVAMNGYLYSIEKNGTLFKTDKN